METRPLGKTGLTVSALGFGGWAIGGNAFGNSYGPTDDDESTAAIKRGLELGCTFFDTADVYGHGHSEELLGSALKNAPDAVVATKVGGNFYGERPVLDFSAKHVRFAVEQSLKRLQRDRIDLCQLHNPSLADLASGDVFDALDKLKQDGSIRAIGVSVVRPEEAIAALASHRVDAVQLPLNLLQPAMAETVIPLAKELNVGVIAGEPLANGFLSGRYYVASRHGEGDFRSAFSKTKRESLVSRVERLRFLEGLNRTLPQAAIRFVLDLPGVSTVIAGAKTTLHVEVNMGAIDSPPLTEQERQTSRDVSVTH